MAIKKINLGRVRGNVDSSSIIEFTVPETYTEPVSGGTLFNIIGNFVKKLRLLGSDIEAANNLIGETQSDVSENTSNINTLQANWDNLTATLLSKVYPVGSIYMSITNNSPQNFLGGTWVVWGSGRVPVSVDTSQTEFNSTEKTGGEKTHTLTQAETPAHAHTFKYSTDAFVGGTIDHWNNVVRPLSETGASTYTTSSVGSGNAHNNLQPYITCYMWKRTA
ncbi:phage baseplate protein [Candidatus Galacturonibacter soehngenii]|uniref:Baseplate structural protein Gp10 C-terminal domain-containing protein n=1 Tax=Candidatus Galacturonatibacter soehngenii TaxID=2307010 RepID=A0A7V7UBG4_9FIRM|nr:hypothetical protein [Candidatus Galacturonibacter soehngenii]KAB1437554.1 hypothetical protein F7O84_08070 [Candidatus Galacturonibacter soehngenii]